MPAITSSKVIAPSTLTPAAREQVIDDLLAVQSQVFEGVTRDIAAKIVESKATDTTLYLHQNAEQQVVGFLAVQLYEKHFQGRTVGVFRAQTGFLREYRGNSVNVRIAIRQIVRYTLAHPGRPIYYFGAILHPSSYLFLSKYADVVWPNHEQPLPVELMAFLDELIHAFGLQREDPQAPLVVNIGWQTRDTEVEHTYWRNSNKPAARFFTRQNPNYSKGYGLVVLVPVEGIALLRIAGRFAADRLRPAAAAALIAVHRLPLAGPLLGVRDVRRRLRGTPLFAAVPDADLTLAARAAEVVVLPAGAFVLRAGEPGEDLYVIAAGSVYALVDRAGEEHVIDQLVVGEMFGEIAMLSGEPRNASIRTAAKTTLIRLKRAALLQLMETHPLMREAVWGAFALRRFELTAGGSTRFGALTRQQRMAWFACGQLQQLAAGERRAISHAWLFLSAGTVEIYQRNAWLTTRAPALIEVDAGLELVAQSPARIALLPALDDAGPVAAGAESHAHKG